MTRLAIVFVIAACGPSPCERLAPRLMPNPDQTFIKRCEERSADKAFARAVDCLLAIEGGLDDADIARCPDSDQVRGMYFHF